MKKKQAKKILLEKLYKNSEKHTKGMFIFGFQEGKIIKKYCTIGDCIVDVETETNKGRQLIDYVQKYVKKTKNKL